MMGGDGRWETRVGGVESKKDGALFCLFGRGKQRTHTHTQMIMEEKYIINSSGLGGKLEYRYSYRFRQIERFAKHTIEGGKTGHPRYLRPFPKFTNKVYTNRGVHQSRPRTTMATSFFFCMDTDWRHPVYIPFSVHVCRRGLTRYFKNAPNAAFSRWGKMPEKRQKNAEILL